MHGQIGAKQPDGAGAFSRRLAARTGKPQAVTAAARKLAVPVYHVLKGDFGYRDPVPTATTRNDARANFGSCVTVRHDSALPSSVTRPVRYSAVSFL
jgi:hypothetical protein